MPCWMVLCGEKVLNGTEYFSTAPLRCKEFNAVGLGERARGKAGSTAEGEEEGGGSVADNIPLRRMMMTMIMMVIALLRVAMVVVLRMAKQAGRAAQTHQRRGER